MAWATQRGEMTGGPGESHAQDLFKQNLEIPFGWFPQPIYFATIARRHMHDYGTTEEQLGAIAVACRRHANLNPEAVMREKPLSMEQYLASPKFVEPFRKEDCCLISDGGSAYIMTTPERAADRPEATGHRRRRRARQRPTAARTGRSSRRSRRHRRCSRRRPRSRWPDSRPRTSTSTPATTRSRSSRLMQLEDSGFCEKGAGGEFVSGDTLHFDSGKLPTNTHGGLLSHAYVLGIAHVVEVVRQLRGEAAAQVPDAEIGIYGGYTGPQCSTLILRSGIVSTDAPGPRQANLPRGEHRVTGHVTRGAFPLPDVTWELTAPFWAGAERGELVIPYCDTCGRYALVPEGRLPDLRRRAVHVEGHAAVRGTLFSWVVVTHTFLPQFADLTPFVPALVVLEEDPDRAHPHPHGRLRPGRSSTSTCRLQ